MSSVASCSGNATALTDESDVCWPSSDDEERESSIIPRSRIIKRMAVIDGCNVVHLCAGLGHYCDPAAKCCERKPDAVGLMLLAKRLLEQGFDFRVFIPPQYLQEKRVANYFILEQFRRMGFVQVVDSHVHDDQALLEFAASVGGFVVSNDKFRDWRNKQLQPLITERLIPLSFRRIPPSTNNATFGTNRDTFHFGMELTVDFDPAVALSRIESDPDFLAVHSQRRLRSVCRSMYALTIIDVIRDFLHQEYCYIARVRAPLLPYFDPSKDVPPSQFAVFLDLFQNYLRLIS